MLTIVYYFLQVILCSGLMMGYYWLVLRNKRFHQYNRFYLLAIALLSWIVPLIKINWGHTPVSNDPQVIQFLSVVADNNSQMDESINQQWFQLSWDTAATFLYLAVAGILLLGMIRAFFRLYQLLKTHSCKSVGDIYLIFTQAKGTPFSFFRYIFWNEEIDLRSEAGKQILQHELTHVQQKHSFDKIFIQVVLIAGWFNPFFWLIKKEMEMIHEFIADRKAVGNGDTASLAQMLLTAAYPQQQFALTNPFFFSPIKRRLKMLTNNRNPRFSYIRRLVVLPLLAIVVILFAFRNKEQRVQGTLSVASVVENVVEKGKDLFTLENIPVKVPAKMDTIIIQADTVYVYGKDKDDVVKIVPVNRASDKPLIIVDGTRMPFSVMKTLDPNLIQSVDVLKGESATSSMYGQEGKNGIILITTKIFASKKPLMIVDGQKADSNVLQIIKPEQIDRIDVLKNESATSVYGDAGKNGVVLITTKVFAEAQKDKDVETGNADNVKGFSGIGLHAIAKDPLDNPAINRKVFVKVAILRNSSDGEKILEEVHETSTDGEGGFVIMIGNGKKSSDIKPNDLSQFNWKNGTWFCNLKVAVPPSIVAPWWVASDNYKDMGTTQMYNVTNLIEPVFWEMKDGEHFSVFKSGNPSHVAKTGRTVPINPENGKPYVNMLVGEKLFTEVQIPAEFPGGLSAWTKYLERNMNRDIVVEKGGPPGKYTVVVSFIVDKTGNVSDVHAENDPGYGTKEEAIRMIVKGPMWNPAMQNGNTVISMCKKPVTWVVSEDNTNDNKPATTNKQENVIIPAKFPGGIPAWDKYLMRNLNHGIVQKNGGPPGKYTVVVSFKVDKTGKVSDVKAKNDPGYGTKEEAIRVIIKGPKWKPAVRNNVDVDYQQKQSIIFVVSDQKAKLDPDKLEPK